MSPSQNLQLPFHLSLTVDQDLQVENASLTLQGLSAAEIFVNFGDYLNMTAEEAEIVFPAPAESTVWSLSFGSLELAFGTEVGGSNSLAGLGGSAGNFRVSFDTAATGLDGLLFTPLDGFFLQVSVPDDFKFGLPDWLPFGAREIGLKFDVDLTDGQPVELEDLSISHLLFSGGLDGNDLWPITGQVEGMEVDLGALAAYGQRLIDSDYAGLSDLGTAIVERGLAFFDGLEFPITNLDLVEFAIEPIDLGGVAIGGGLGLGLLNIDGDGPDPVTGEIVRDQTALYGRILGQLVVSEVGIGVELIVTEYGPVLARLHAGIPIPIGAIVGAAVGVWFFGVGAAAGANIGDSTGFLISGFEGGINFGDNRIEIDDPLELLDAPILFSPLSVDLNATIEKVEKAAQNTS